MECADSDDDYEYEETTIVAEIQGVMDVEFLADVKQAKILGVDCEKPLLQLDDYTFSGHYEDTMGTCMLFKDVTDNEDPQNTSKKLEFSCLSNKKLCLQSVFLKKNDDKIPEFNKEGAKIGSPGPSVSTTHITPETVPVETGLPQEGDVSVETDKLKGVERNNTDIADTNSETKESRQQTSDLKDET